MINRIRSIAMEVLSSNQPVGIELEKCVSNAPPFSHPYHLYRIWVSIAGIRCILFYCMPALHRNISLALFTNHNVILSSCLAFYGHTSWTLIIFKKTLLNFGFKAIAVIKFEKQSSLFVATTYLFLEHVAVIKQCDCSDGK